MHSDHLLETRRGWPNLRHTSISGWVSIEDLWLTCDIKLDPALLTADDQCLRRSGISLDTHLKGDFWMTWLEEHAVEELTEVILSLR